MDEQREDDKVAVATEGEDAEGEEDKSENVEEDPLECWSECPSPNGEGDIIPTDLPSMGDTRAQDFESRLKALEEERDAARKEIEELKSMLEEGEKDENLIENSSSAVKSGEDELNNSKDELNNSKDATEEAKFMLLNVMGHLVHSNYEATEVTKKTQIKKTSEFVFVLYGRVLMVRTLQTKTSLRCR